MRTRYAWIAIASSLALLPLAFPAPTAESASQSTSDKPVVTNPKYSDFVWVARQRKGLLPQAKQPPTKTNSQKVTP